MEFEQSIASAPGDLPPELVAQRYFTAAGQFRHDNWISPGTPRPGKPVHITARSGARMLLSSAVLRYTTDATIPDSSSKAVEMSPAATDFYPFGEYGTLWTAEIPPQDDGTWVRYRIEGVSPSGELVPAQDGQGFWFRYPPEQSVTLFSYRVAAADVGPQWFKDAVVYQIFVDRFSGQQVAGAGPREKHGGTLAGITERLAYIRSLGVDCLWLSPVGPAPSYHRYDATSFFETDPDLGTVEDLRALVASAHSDGIRVILDFVPCHLSDRHPAFLDAKENRESEYADWFVFYKWPGEYRSFLEMAPSLVSLNTQSTGAREHIKAAARFWIEQCDVDGFRLDHVIGHGMDFWCDLQRDLERVKNDVVTVGEATDTGDALVRYAGRISSIMDFPLARALRLTFGARTWKPTQFEAFLGNYERYMADGPDRASFLDNHDMERFLFVADQNAAALARALLCMFTLAPTPVLYYGTEIGMTEHDSFENAEAGGDAQARQDMIWDESRWNQELLTTTRALTTLRKRHPTLRGGRREMRGVDDATGLYHYARLEQTQELHVVFVLGEEPQEVELPGQLTPLLTVPVRTIDLQMSEGLTSQRRWTIPPGAGVLFGSE